MKVYLDKPINLMQGRKASPEETAREFEAILLKEVLKEAFRPIVKNKSFQERMYYDTFLEGLSRKIALSGGIGVSEFILKSLKGYGGNRHSKE